jgi:hypothetical protein
MTTFSIYHPQLHSISGSCLLSPQLLGRCRCTCDDDIKMDLKEIGWEGVDWINFAQDRDKWP